MRVVTPAPQNDMRGCPPCLWIPFDNRAYPADDSPTDLRVYTGDGERHTLALSAGNATGGLWGVDGYISPNRAADGTYQTTGGNTPVWRAPDASGTSSDLAVYVRDMLRFDTLSVGEGMLVLYAGIVDPQGTIPAVSYILDYVWLDAAGANAGRFHVRASTTGGRLATGIAAAGGALQNTELAVSPTAGEFHCQALLLEKTAATTVDVHRAIQGLSNGAAVTLTVASMPGSGDTPPVSSANGLAIFGQSGTATGSKFNNATTGNCQRGNARSFFVGRVTADALANYGAIVAAHYARRGAVPFDLLRGIGA